MASQEQDLAHKGGELAGQAQVKKDEVLNGVSNKSEAASERSSGIAKSVIDTASQTTAQAATFIQQTGEQVKSAAQGAAEAVKNTLGINSSDPSSGNSTTPPPTN